MIAPRDRRKVNRHPTPPAPALPRLQPSVLLEWWITVAKPRGDLSGGTEKEAKRPGRRRLKEMEISDQYSKHFCEKRV